MQYFYLAYVQIAWWTYDHPGRVQTRNHKICLRLNLLHLQTKTPMSRSDQSEHSIIDIDFFHSLSLFTDFSLRYLLKIGKQFEKLFFLRSFQWYFVLSLKMCKTCWIFIWFWNRIWPVKRTLIQTRQFWILIFSLFYRGILRLTTVLSEIWLWYLIGAYEYK